MNELLNYNLQFFAEEETQTEQVEQVEKKATEKPEKKETDSTPDMQELLNRIATLERKADKASAEAADYKRNGRKA